MGLSADGMAAYPGPMRPVLLRGLLALSFSLLSAGAQAIPRPYDVTEKPIDALRRDLASGRVTAVGLVRAYEARIRRLDPRLRAVIVLNPEALNAARAADAARRAGRPAGPLAGVPILLKDNIESADPMATTAGSLALKDNVTGHDAGLVTRLRDAGAIILGKTNLSEWANIRSAASLSGWSAVGGQTRNPYDPLRSPCGSSAGSAVAAAASFAAAAVGTETDGSVTCPAAVNGVVGFKPTLGLISRARIIPISARQDTAGPMGRTVSDVALLLGVMAGSDPLDPATAEADARRVDYAAGLDAGALKGVRIGVMRFAADFHPETKAAFEIALQALARAGAELVDIPDAFPERDRMGPLESAALHSELKADLGAYLATTDPARVRSRSLADLIGFNQDHADQEMALFGQDTFEAAQAAPDTADPAYVEARAEAKRIAGPDGIDRLLADNRVAVLVAPTLAPAWLIDPVLKDHFVGGGAGSPAAVAGYPHLTVPMGQVQGLPVGLSFIGTAWSDARVLAYGYAYEQASHARVPPNLDRPK